MSPDQSPPKPPGYIRRQWHALGTNRAGRLLRLAIVAVTGWTAVEVTVGLGREAYRSAFINMPGYAVSYASNYALGLRVQTEKDIEALAEAPVYPLPPICLTDPRYTGKADFYDRLQACIGNHASFDPIFGGQCSFDVHWKTTCVHRVYYMHVLQHQDTYERLISSIKNPCLYLPSPEKIAQASGTHESWVTNLNEAWIDAGCDGAREISPYWYQLDFIDRDAAPDSPERKIIMMVSNRM